MNKNVGLFSKIRRQFLVTLFCLIMIGLGVRSLATQDARFGWGMFVHLVEYEIEYFRESENGEVSFRADGWVAWGSGG